MRLLILFYPLSLSTTSVGVPITEVHRDLIGYTDITFTDELGEADVIFLCLGHGLSKEFIDKYNPSSRCRIIDLGNDFRLDPIYKDREFIYGLTDTYYNKIVTAKNIANPGCFATAIQSAITPLAKAGLLCNDIHVTAITGSTGAGKKPTETSHFSYRDNNLSIYKLFTHQHLGEINRTLTDLMGGKSVNVNFVPFRGDFARGIFASLYTELPEGAKELGQEYFVKLYNEYYKESPFVFVSNKGVSLKEVVNTNKVLLHIELHNNILHISSVIDNLVKGASGQAVENMNIIFGLDRCAGLQLKPSAF